MRRFALPLFLLVGLSVLAAGRLVGQEASPEELLKLGDTYFGEKTYKKAVEAYERLLATAPAHPEAHRVRMNIARGRIGLNQWGEAWKGLGEMLPGTGEGTRERAEVLGLLGGTSAQRRGGSKEIVDWLEEAQKVYGAIGEKDARRSVLFDLGYALSYSYDYGIEYADFERDRKDRPDATETEWDKYQRRRMREIDEARYARTVEVYREIVAMDGKGHDAARARYMLGCFHLNVLASVFGTDSIYYPEALPADELAAKRQEILERYLSEVRKGIEVLREVIREQPEDALADDAQYLIAVARKDRLNGFPEAEKEYEELLSKWPATEWADTARAALQEIRKEEIRLSVPKPFRPREGNEMLLAARNVRKIRFAAYRVDIAQLLRGEYVFHDLSKIDTGPLSAFAEWEVATGVADDRLGVQMPVKLPFSAAGSFLVVADGEASTCRVLVLLSDLAMVVRTGDGIATLFAADSVTGEPREGVRFTVKAVSNRGRSVTTKLYEGVSGPDGVAVIALDGLPPGGSSLQIVGRREDHVALSGEWTHRGRDEQPFRVYTFTDRPVYRPGQTVHLKSIVRAATDQGLRAVDGKAVKVEIADPQGRKLLERTLATGAEGSVSADLAMEAEPALGVYQIRVFIDGQQYYTTGWTGAFFRVEEYKKPEFEVTVDAGVSRVRPGESVTAKVGAKYYFGAPVAAGEATWQVFRRPYHHYMPVRREYRWYYEDMYAEPRSYWGQELVAEGAGPLDAEGAISIDFPTKEYPDELDSRFEVAVKVTDASRREIHGSAAVFATKQPFFARVETRRFLMKPGDLAEVSIRTEDANRKPVASEGKLTLAKRADREEEKDGKKVTVVDFTIVASVDAKTGEDGSGVASLVLDETGQFRLSYVTAGAGGEEIRADTFVWVVDRDFRGSQYRFSGVEISTDSDTYAVGGEMQVFVRSQFEDASIVLTVEADREILFRRVVKAGGRAVLETIPVGENFVPNVFVKAMTIRNELVFTARTQVVIPPVRRFLDVKLTPAREGTFLPGEEAKFTLTATDANGEPAEAELSVGFVDASILYIAPDQTPDIRQFFYGRKRGDGVSLSSSFDFSFAASEMAKPGRKLTEYRTQNLPQFMNPWFYSFHGMRGDLTEAWGAVAPPSPGGYGELFEGDGGRQGFSGRGGAKAGAPPEAMRRRSESKSLGAADDLPEASAEAGGPEGDPGAPPGEARKF
ncbi:MAG: MG2 domain-containing protein, partial [Planctomycetes bacterium]|nr:MG2 domain-containing protein [Planctomycetota bacterium]